MKEVKLGRVAGPFEQIPFEHFIQSPIGLVPKAGSDGTRLIFHLSYDFKDGLKLLNSFTPKEKCGVKYKDLDFVVQAYLKLCEEILQQNEDVDELNDVTRKPTRKELSDRWHQTFAQDHQRKVRQPIYAAKSDIKSAFRILGLSKDSWKWLVIKTRDPLTKEWQFFVNKCLPFGASISCTLFQ